MMFESPSFLYLFLPVILIISLFPWLRKNKIFLIAVSLSLYYFYQNSLLFPLLTMVLVTYTTGWLIQKADKPIGRWFLITGVVFNLVVLITERYGPFIISSINIFSVLIGRPLGLQGYPAPQSLGISFITFTTISYLFDCYQNKITKSGFIDFLLYITFFPKIASGPIVRFSQMFSGRIKKVPLFAITNGVRRIIYGLGKKVVIANAMAIVADSIFMEPTAKLTFITAWIGAISYTIQIYFDFSGYTDIAIGLGQLLGFVLPENFNNPYAATSIRDFWRRWHITLSDWLKDYLYIPLGGNRISPARTYLNIMAVFLLCGLWHGAGWTFIVWGFWHGFWLVQERAYLDKIFSKIPVIWNRIYSLTIIIFGWVIFRSPSVAYALKYLAAMAGFNHRVTNFYPWGLYLTKYWLFCLITGLVFCLPRIKIIKKMYQVHLNLLLTIILLIYILSEVSLGNFIPNIYSQF